MAKHEAICLALVNRPPPPHPNLHERAVNQLIQQSAHYDLVFTCKETTGISPEASQYGPKNSSKVYTLIFHIRNKSSNPYQAIYSSVLFPFSAEAGCPAAQQGQYT